MKCPECKKELEEVWMSPDKKTVGHKCVKGHVNGRKHGLQFPTYLIKKEE